MSAVATTGKALVLAVLVTLGMVACASSQSRLERPSGREPGEALADPRAAAFDGIWSGKWIRQKCDEAGGAVGVACRNVPEEQPLRLRLTHDGSNAAGTLELGTLQTPVSGSVNADGALTLRGRHDGDTHTLTLRSWQSSVDHNTMSGTFVFSIAPDNDALGTVNVTAVLRDVVRQRH